MRDAVGLLLRVNLPPTQHKGIQFFYEQPTLIRELSQKRSIPVKNSLL